MNCFYDADRNYYCKKCIDDYRASDDDNTISFSDEDYPYYFSMQIKRLLCEEDEDCVDYDNMTPARCRLCTEPEDNRCQMCRFGEMKLNKVFHWGFKEGKSVIKECQVCFNCSESTTRELNDQLSIVTEEKIFFEYVEETGELEEYIYSEDEFDDLEKLLAESSNRSNDPECKSDYSWEDI